MEKSYILILANLHLSSLMGFPGGAMVETPPANAGDVDLIPGLGRSPGGGNPLQYSCRGNPMDRGGCWATVRGITKSQTRLSERSTAHQMSWTRLGN